MWRSVAVVVLFWSLAARADAPVEDGKVYLGNDGEEVSIVPLKPRSDNKALIQFRGFDSDFDKKIIPHTIEADGDGRNYVTQYKGEDYHSVVVRVRDGSSTYEVWVPGRRAVTRVKYDTARTAALKPEELYKQFQKQGSLASLSAFNRDEVVQRNEKALAEELALTNKACASKLPIKIEWSSVTDAMAKKYSIASYCEAPLTALRHLCDGGDTAKKAVQQKVKNVTCKFGPALKVELGAGTLHWTTADAANLAEFVEEWLKRNL